jgi:hypothetical protein
MIKINLEKAKDISHNLRREARTAEFEPYDNVIAKQIPGETKKAEIERKKIREKYAAYQTQIDEAQTAEELAEIVKFQ